MDDACIIGFGFVGKASAKALNIPWHFSLSDSNITLEEVAKKQFIIFCTPTPTNTKYAQEGVDIIDGYIKQIKEYGGRNIFIIRSTVLPGTCKHLAEKYDVMVAHNPELLSEDTWEYDALHPKAIIIGADDVPTRIAVTNLWKNYKIKNFIVTDTVTSETIKYAYNLFFLTKIIWANQMYDICQINGAKYNTIKEAIYAHPWGTHHHLKPVHKGGRGGGGHCLTPDTKIFTMGGVSKIKDIAVGDLVLTHSGLFRRVTDVFTRKVNEEIYEIKPQGFEKFGITSGHMVFAFKANRKYELRGGKLKFSNFLGEYQDIKPEWIDSDDLEKGDFLVFPRIKIIPTKSYQNTDLARLVGYYISEGSVDKYKNRIAFALHEKETFLVEDISSIIKKNFNVDCHVHKNTKTGHGIVVRCSSKNLKEFLLDYGGKLAENKSLCTFLFVSSEQTLKEFLKGYYRGDGSKSTGVYTMATTSEILFYQLQMILFKFGIGHTTKVVPPRTGKDGTKHNQSYWIRIRNYVDIQRFGEIVGDKIVKDLKLNRKTSWFDKEYLYVPIREVKKKPYKGKVYNLEVEEDNTYTTTSGVVHNCFPKDVKAFAKYSNLKLFEVIDELNDGYLQASRKH